ncbi:MAG TPA: endonuclease [Thermoleophilaceae bacterium]
MSSLEEALAQLWAGEQAVYYDAEADDRDRASYYADVSNGLDPAQLFQALSRLVSDTHRRQPEYRPHVEVYPWVDLQPDRTLRSIYTDEVYDPETLIREDAETEERRRDERARLITEGLTLRDLEAELETTLPYNCEHVYCQSWFDHAEPMRGDVHHLFACESKCNSFRGNFPYDDFPDYPEVVRDPCGRRERSGFEPAHGKAKAARAALYFLIRYPEVSAASPRYDAEHVTMLQGWHAASGPEEHERHRNAAIFARQGNRNPLIDFPEWSERIDFGARPG